MQQKTSIEAGQKKLPTTKFEIFKFHKFYYVRKMSMFYPFGEFWQTSRYRVTSGFLSGLNRRKSRQTDGRWAAFGRPYYRSCLSHTVSSVCLSVCRLSVCRPSVTFCIVAKRYVLAKNCLKERIGNHGQVVAFLGRRHISTSGFGSAATETAVFALFLPVQMVQMDFL